MTWSSPELRRFHGGRVGVALENRLDLSLDFGLVRWHEVGSLCGGLILDPSTCVSESLSVGSETTGVAVGFSLLDLSMPGGTLVVAPSAGFAVATLRRTGQSTHHTIDDGLAMFELGLAVRYRTHPLWGDLVGLLIELETSGGAEIGSDRCEDCLDLLRGSATRRALLVGFSIGR